MNPMLLLTALLSGGMNLFQGLREEDARGMNARRSSDVLKFLTNEMGRTGGLGDVVGRMRGGQPSASQLMQANPMFAHLPSMGGQVPTYTPFGPWSR